MLCLGIFKISVNYQGNPLTILGGTDIIDVRPNGNNFESEHFFMSEEKIFYPIREIENFRDLLTQSVHLFGSLPAYRLKGADGTYYPVTYQAFQDDVNAVGAALMQLGLHGEKIAVSGENSYQWETSYLGITCGVGVVVPIDRELPADDFVNLLTVSGAKAVFCDQKRQERIMGCLDRIPQEITLICFNEAEDRSDRILSYDKLMARGRELIRNGDRSFQDTEIDGKALGSLIFTSGTTGMAKGVMLSQYNICSDLMALSGVVKIRTDDQVLSVLPLHHTYESSLGFLFVLYSGACISFCEGLKYLAKNMQEVQPTIFVTVPLMLEKLHKRILKAAGEKKGGKAVLGFGKMLAKASSAIGVNVSDKVFATIHKTFGGRLRLLITGAAAIAPNIVDDFRTFGLEVYLGYGLTECSPLVIGNNDRLALSDSVGVPLPGVEAKVINPDFSGVGEICVRGPMIMMGYYNAPEQTAEVIDAEGWFHTGDLGTVDEQGHYRITGRIKNVIVTKNGKNIYPEEVEYYLNNDPFISESIVSGEDGEDDLFVTANVFPNVQAIKEKKKKQTLTTEEIAKAIADVVKEINKKLPSYKNIKRIHIRDTEFVKTTTQKIKRFAVETKEDLNKILEEKKNPPSQDDQ